MASLSVAYPEASFLLAQRNSRGPGMGRDVPCRDSAKTTPSRSGKRKARLFHAIALARPIGPRKADLSNRVAPKYARATVVQAQARPAIRTEIAYDRV